MSGAKSSKLSNTGKGFTIMAHIVAQAFKYCERMIEIHYAKKRKRYSCRFVQRKKRA